MASPSEPAPRRPKRTDIQALRAVAVAAVLIFHAWPHVLPGGYVGVDVFFVISGYVIAGGMLAEQERTGRIAIWSFWARRIRRLLPASALVLAVCLAATVVWLPQVDWEHNVREIAAAATYHENWQLSRDAVDYLASENSPSLVQHFWSLSLEEQIYLVWPLLMTLVLLAARRRPRQAIGAVLAVMAGYGLWRAVTIPEGDPSGYFSTAARCWEFALGALAVLGAGRLRRLPRISAWVGLAAIAVACVVLTGATRYPGWWTLLPVLGAAIVLQADVAPGRWSPRRWLDLPVMQWIGDHSYGLYLWHWPLLLLLARSSYADTPGAKTVALAATVGVAAATKRFVEDPVRQARGRIGGRSVALAGLVGATTLLVVATGSVRADLRDRVGAEEHRAQLVANRPPRCFGAASADPADPCANPALRTMVVPLPVAAAKLGNPPCESIVRDDPVSACGFGVPAGSARRSVAVIGDSHSVHWRPALDPIARARRWHGVSISRSGCPYTLAGHALPTAHATRRCQEWVRALPDWLRRHPEISTILVSDKRSGTVDTAPGESQYAAKLDGYRRAWAALPPSVKRIVVLRDPPQIDQSIADCVARAADAHQDAGHVCAVPRRRVLLPDPQASAARRTPRAAVVDITPAICPGQRCYPVVGGALVFKDFHHLTVTFARTLSPLLERGLLRSAPDLR